MCGIVGVVDARLGSEQARECTMRMADQIVHRGPDDQGHASYAGMSIGMRRLSIIDLSGGHQPIANEAGDIQVVCNGEIYNFVELRNTLISQGHRFTTGSDTEVVVHLYEQHGDQFLQYLRGMFGLAILDRRNNRVLFARDRLGKKPMFFSNSRDRLLFGSEMKSLLAADPGLAEPNYETLGEFFQLGYIHQPRTIYRNIERLPAAHYAVYEREKLSIKSYWNLDFKADESLSDKQWTEQLDATLSESVKIRLRSDVPLGVFLSGGLDSSAIVAYASLAGLKPLKTFTIGFDRPEWDESNDALAVARHYDTEHHLLRLSEADMLNSLEDTLLRIVGFCDEPFGDASALPTYHVSKLAREHVTVTLSGDGGDELFAGYSNYRGMLFAQSYRKLLPNWLGRHVLPGVVQAVSQMVPGSLGYKGLRFAKIFRDSALPMLEAYRDKVSIWRAAELRELLDPELIQSVDYLGEQFLPDNLLTIMTRRDRDLVSRLTEMDINSYLLDDILVKVDRMSMAHSLEVRSPLLDQQVAELAAKMPTRMKIRGGRGKHVLRELLRDKLPKQSIRKGKQGFAVPLRDWFRGKLSAMLHEYLGPDGFLPTNIFQQRKVQSILREHQQGSADHARKLWLLLVFAVWHRRYQQQPGRSCNLLHQEATSCAS